MTEEVITLRVKSSESIQSAADTRFVSTSEHLTMSVCCPPLTQQLLQHIYTHTRTKTTKRSGIRIAVSFITTVKLNKS